MSAARPLFPYEQTFAGTHRTAVPCHKATYAVQQQMRVCRARLTQSPRRRGRAVLGGILKPSAVTQYACARGRAGGARRCSLVKRFRSGFMLIVTAAVASLGRNAYIAYATRIENPAIF